MIYNPNTESEQIQEAMEWLQMQGLALLMTFITIGFTVFSAIKHNGKWWWFFVLSLITFGFALWARDGAIKAYPEGFYHVRKK